MKTNKAIEKAIEIAENRINTDEPVIKSWTVVLTTTDEEAIAFDINNDHIAGIIDDFIKEQYETDWD